MSRASPIQTAFNAGEISPRLGGRVDLERYPVSCSRMRNFIPTVQGPAVKRPGTRYICPAPPGDEPRLVAFEFSRTQSYQLAFGHLVMWVLKDGGGVSPVEPVLEPGAASAITGVAIGSPTSVTTGAPHQLLTGDAVFLSAITGTVAALFTNRILTVTVTGASTFTVAVDSTGFAYTGGGSAARLLAISTPYSATGATTRELRKLSITQSADVMFLAHPSHPPKKLLRHGDNDWTLTDSRGYQLGAALSVTGITLGATTTVTTGAPHNYAVGERVFFSRITSTRELNGVVATVATVPTATTFTLAINSAAYHAFILAGQPSVQKVTLEEFPAVLAEPIHTNVLVGVTGGEDVGSAVTVFATAPIFGASHVGSRIRLREVPEIVHPQWKAKENLADDLNAAINVGDFCQYEGNVYELIEKTLGAATGNTPPTHTIPGEQQTDHKWTWEYAHSGVGTIEITAFLDTHRLSGVIRRRVPQSMVALVADIETTNGVIARAAATQVNLTAHDYQNGDRIFVYGVGGMVELNERMFYTSRVSAAVIGLFMDEALTVPLDSTGFGADGTAGTGTWLPVREATGAYDASHRYAFEAWSVLEGYPRAVVFHQDRLWWASTSGQPQTMWASETAFYESHATTRDETTALEFTLNARDMNGIEWLSSSDELVIGTAGGIFVGRGAETGRPIGLENVLSTVPVYPNGVRESSPFLRIDGVLLFVQRSARKLRELIFEDLSKSYRAPDLAEAADHILLPGIAALAYQAEPHRLVWTAMADGSLATLTYDRQEEVVAWAPQRLGGPSGTGSGAVWGGFLNTGVLSVSVTPHLDGDGDQLFLVVRRAPGGVASDAVFSIESLEKFWTGPNTDLGSSPVEDAEFLDSAAGVLLGAPSNTFSGRGIYHLEGLDVLPLVDGTVRDAETVVDGTIVVSGAAGEKFLVGLPMGPAVTDGAELVTSRLEAGARDGTAQGKVKRQHELVLRLDETGDGLTYGADLAGDMDALVMREGQDPAGAVVTLISGDTEEVTLPGGYDRTGQIAVKHSLPLPCTLVALMPKGATEDRL